MLEAAAAAASTRLPSVQVEAHFAIVKP